MAKPHPLTPPYMPFGTQRFGNGRTHSHRGFPQYYTFPISSRPPTYPHVRQPLSSNCGQRMHCLRPSHSRIRPAFPFPSFPRFIGTMGRTDFFGFSHASWQVTPAARLCVPLVGSVPSRSPPLRAITFIPCSRLIYRVGFGHTSLRLASSSVPVRPSMRYLFIGLETCLQVPSDLASRRTPLLLG